MKVLFLGTGTSSGVPLIGCECRVCRSTDPRNNRLRTSIYLQCGGTHLLVDASADFRQQALRYRIPRVDAVLFTHSHADHIFGFDEIRRYNTMQNGMIPAYGLPETIADLRRVFNYTSTEKVPGLYRPLVEYREISGEFQLGDLKIVPVPVVHGESRISGFCFEAGGRRLGYVPDCSEMPDATVDLLKGVDVMILDALRHHPHKTHLTVLDSVALLRRIKAGKSYLIHMCHDLDHAETERELPENIRLSQDGMVIDLK